MTPTPLSSSQLARYIGKRVEFEQRDMDGIFQAHTDTLTLTGLLDAEMFRANGEASFIRNIRPVLRRLSSITEEEMLQLARVGLPEASSGDRTHSFFDQDGLNICNADDDSFTIEKSGFIRPNCGWDVATAINACAIIDFLDEIGIDQRGYIEKGLAVEAK